MRWLERLADDCRGTMMIETALVAPVLLLLGVGGYQVSDLVARQHALQAAAAEAEQIALAAKPDTQAKLNTIQSILVATTGLASSNVTLSFQYRCGTTTTMQDTNACGAEVAWTFVHVVLTDTFTPTWAAYGVGSNIPLRVDRKVQIS